MSWSKIIRGAIAQRLKVPGLSIRRVMAAATLFPVAFGLTACTRDYTVAYLYVTGATTSGPGVVNEYQVDYLSGALVTVPGSPAQAGVNPVTLVTSPGGLFVYVINQGDSTVQEFAVNTGSGALALKNTYSTGSRPTAAAIDPAGKFLYVTFTYQAGYSSANPGPGGIDIFPINSDNSLGNSTVVKVGNNPVGVAASNFNHFVYVVDQEPAVGNASQFGMILGFAQDPNTGALTPAPGTEITTVSGKTVATGYKAGTQPSAIVEDPTARFVYVTDYSTSQLYGNLVQAAGQLVPMPSSPFATGLQPVAITIDPRGKYMYVANYNAYTVSSYVIDQATGGVTGAVGSTGVAVGTGPTCVAIDPAVGIYLYTSNAQDNSVTGLQLDPHNGTLKNIENTPFQAAGLPTCAAAVANGSHVTQIVVP